MRDSQSSVMGFLLGLLERPEISLGPVTNLLKYGDHSLPVTHLAVLAWMRPDRSPVQSSTLDTVGTGDAALIAKEDWPLGAAHGL